MGFCTDLVGTGLAVRDGTGLGSAVGDGTGLGSAVGTGEAAEVGSALGIAVGSGLSEQAPNTRPATRNAQKSKTVRKSVAVTRR
jgi:UDP-3-O-[3-hydroxymyristoyl] glucosamine N-acyltransferase